MDYTKKIIYLKAAIQFSKLSRCIKEQKACIIVKDDQIISVGVNGTPQNDVNCDEFFTDEYDEIRHERFVQDHEIEAEVNAIINCAKRGISTNNAEMYMTSAPNLFTAKYIISAGITSVYYLHDNDDTSRVASYLMNLNIQIEKIGV